MRQLLPVPVDPVDPLVAYDDVPDDRRRPWVRLSMVTSLDGAISIDGRSGGLGGPGDRRSFVALRSLADVLLVAAGTVRAEGYGPATLAADLQDCRLDRGMAAVPPIAVVSRSCRLDWRSSFFSAAVARPLVVTVEAAPAAARAQAAEVADVLVAGSDDVDLVRAVDLLAERGWRSVLAEGGPTLNAQLVASGLLDELCLTLSPRLLGGDARRILSGGALTSPPGFDLHAACEEEGFLFLRYRSPRAG